MRLSPCLLLIGAATALIIVLAVSTLIINPNQALIQNAGFEFEVVTPNADGDRDVVPFAYTLARPAVVTIAFENTDGQRFVFRNAQPRSPGAYTVLFSGVVDGFTLPDETFEGEIERRLIPDGIYTWTLTADGTQRDENQTANGTLTVQDGDAALPVITAFTMNAPSFTPNQDGVTDRMGMSVVISKQADVSAYLINPNGERFVIGERETVYGSDAGFRREFDYDGGLDINADPPPDGTYTVLIEVQDAVGQRTSVQADLTIERGGKPYAEIVGQPTGPDVVFAVRPYDPRYYSSADGWGERIDTPSDSEDLNQNTITVPLGDLLVFKLVVENYGTSPLRTSGPPPGTVYEQTQLAPSLGIKAFDQAGVWRVGIQCANSAASYPWRWALGDETTLESMYDPVSGNTYLYLPPGERAVVWGAIRMTELVPAANPQTCYAGLIHEGVNISVRNMVVGARSVLLQSPTQVNEFNVPTPTPTP
jgi:hypothetical protein